jgi:hypothetical protein
VIKRPLLRVVRHGLRYADVCIAQSAAGEGMALHYARCADQLARQPFDKSDRPQPIAPDDDLRERHSSFIVGDLLNG